MAEKDRPSGKPAQHPSSNAPHSNDHLKHSYVPASTSHPKAPVLPPKPPKPPKSKSK